MICLPQSPSRFPYTTLFRSRTDRRGAEDARGDRQAARPYARARPPDRAGVAAEAREPAQRLQLDLADALARKAERSEEHTSELQSPDHLVCRLLLEKKKYNQ